MNAAMAKAMLSGRNYTLPDDVQAMIKPVLATG
jgi:MoxR-like ATPase